MTTARTTQIVVEVLRQAVAPPARATQQVVEVLRQAVAPPARVTQVVVEVLRQATAPPLRISHVPVEVMRAEDAGDGTQNAQLSQVAMEVIREYETSRAILSQAAIEVARINAPAAILGLKSWMVFDPDGSFEATMVAGEAPTSAANELEVLNGANAGLLGNEVLQWRDVTDLGNNRYRFSHLLRGRMGTEQFMTTHQPGERLVLLNSSTVQRINMSLSEVGQTLLWKIVGAGKSDLTAPISAFINSGNSLRPWAPLHVTGSRDGPGELTIDWFRRSRIGIEWRDLVDVPIGEDEEKYEVDIFNAAGTAVVRTLTVTTPQAVYTVADQTTDFGSAQANVIIKIYQMSVAIGRGYPASAVV